MCVFYYICLRMYILGGVGWGLEDESDRLRRGESRRCKRGILKVVYRLLSGRKTARETTFHYFEEKGGEILQVHARINCLMIQHFSVVIIF